MVTLHEGKQFIINNDHIASAEEAAKLSEEAAKKETLTWQVLSKHNHSDNMEHLEIQFDYMGVSIIPMSESFRLPMRADSRSSRCRVYLPTAITACVQSAVPSTPMSTNMQNLPAANPAVSSFRRLRQLSTSICAR